MKKVEHFQHPPFLLAGPGFRFTLPLKWEVGAYQHEDRMGRYSFSSEAGAHGQFSWRRVTAVPDIPRIIEEIHRRELGEEAPPKLKFTRHGADANVYLAHTKPGERFYASVFNPGEKLLNEWIFPSYSPDAAQTVIPMLDSYTHNPADVSHRIFYAIFGLEVLIPDSFLMKKVEPYPTAITMHFENRKHHKLLVHRWGMADINMQGADVTNFYHRALYAKRYAIKNASGMEIGGHEGSHITFRTRGKFGFDYVLGPWWRGEGEAFLKPSENRIYAVEHIASARIAERETAKAVFRTKLAERPI